MLLKLLILISKLIQTFAITCVSYSGSTSSNYRVTTNVTGPGDTCCAVKAWAGTFFGVDYKPYNSKTEMCCKGNSYFVGNVQYQMSGVGEGNACCNDLAYDSSVNKCCSEYNLNSQSYSNNVGLGDSCCGTKPYYKEKQACCNYYISAISMTVYSVGDGCCKFGTVSYNKTFQVCCNGWKVGNGDSCCNFNGEENYNEPPDEPYYTRDKCCVKGKLYDYVCLNRSNINSFSFELTFLFICLEILFTL